MTDTLKIEEYSLVDFVMKVQQGILEGYEVTDSSDDAPLQIGGGYHVILRKKNEHPKVIGKAVFQATIDTAKLQEQLKSGGEIEQMLADSLVVAEKTDGEHETSIDEVPIPEPEPTMDEEVKQVPIVYPKRSNKKKQF